METIKSYLDNMFAGLPKTARIMDLKNDILANMEEKEENKVVGAVASFVWPLAVIIFLVAGLVFDLWYICWIVFPITGILFGMFSAVYSTLKGNNNA